MTIELCKFCKVKAVAYPGARYCGAGCTARAEGHETPPQVEITWTVEEFIGTEVLKEGSDQPLTNSDDIKEGDMVLVCGMNGQYLPVRVHKDGDGWYAAPPMVTSENKYIVPLQFAEDRRKCWVALGIFNRDALAQLRLD
jgi:hypothetical protein